MATTIFQTPIKLIVGAGSVEKVGEEAAKLGIDIRSIRGNDRRNDTFIKEKINAQRSKDVQRQKKKEKAREKVHNGEKNG